MSLSSPSGAGSTELAGIVVDSVIGRTPHESGPGSSRTASLRYDGRRSPVTRRTSTGSLRWRLLARLTIGSLKLSESPPVPVPVPGPSSSVLENTGMKIGMTTAVASARLEIRRPVALSPLVSIVVSGSGDRSRATSRPQCASRSRSSTISIAM